MTSKRLYSQPDTNITLASSTLLRRKFRNLFDLEVVMVDAFAGIANVLLDGEVVGTVNKHNGEWYPNGQTKNLLYSDREISIAAYRVAGLALGI